MTLKLSVLDQSPLRTGATPRDALEETLELARLTDQLGYSRYWLAEHHNSSGLMGPAPEILIARIAAETEGIRVGSGGVMLMHYSPYKVAEWFRVLETLHPGRIDLGVGRAPGSDGITAAALAYGNGVGPEYFGAKVVDLANWVGGRAPFTEALAPVAVSPSGETRPELWLLGSSDQSGRLAAHLGQSFSFAHFIAPEKAEQALTLYRDRFEPSPDLSAPRANLGVFVLCAESEAEAHDLGLCRDLWRRRLSSGGEPGPWPTVKEARRELGGRLAADGAPGARQILGTPDQVREALEALAARCAVDELSVVSITPTFEQRQRVYEHLAREFQLTPRRAGPASEAVRAAG